MPEYPELARLGGQIESIELSSRPRRVLLSASERQAVAAIRSRQRAESRPSPVARRPARRRVWLGLAVLLLGLAWWLIWPAGQPPG